MTASCVLGGSYGPFGVEKSSLPEVFHIEDDFIDFSCEDIGGPIVGELQLSGVTEDSNVGERSITSLIEAKNELLAPPALEDFGVHTDLCVPVSLKFHA